MESIISGGKIFEIGRGDVRGGVGGMIFVDPSLTLPAHGEGTGRTLN